MSYEVEIHIKLKSKKKIPGRDFCSGHNGSNWYFSGLLLIIKPICIKQLFSEIGQQSNVKLITEIVKTNEVNPATPP